GRRARRAKGRRTGRRTRGGGSPCGRGLRPRRSARPAELRGWCAAALAASSSALAGVAAGVAGPRPRQLHAPCPRAVRRFAAAVRVRIPNAVAEQPGPGRSAFDVILAGVPWYEGLRAFRRRARRGGERVGSGTTSEGGTGSDGGRWGRAREAAVDRCG